MRRLAIVLASSCIGGAAIPAQEPIRREFTEVHMGVPVRVVLYATSDSVASVAASAAFARIAELDGKMSDYRPQSEVQRLAREAGEWKVVSDELFDVLSRALAIASLSGGAFDPTVGPLVSLWRESRRSRRLPGALELNDARERVGWQRVELDSTRHAVRLEQGTQLDLGGIAKGYIIQAALEVLRSRGVSSALVEAGGDVVAGDAPPGREGWTVEVPGAAPAFARRAAALRNASLATSGSSEQFVEIAGVRYSHVVDPRTGLGLTTLGGVSVIARDAALADAMATALLVLGPDRGSGLAVRRGIDVDFRPR